ncbi:hypothetical protein CMI47_12600 [Candidatus Pacearchaeota archaeon]|nr:hypothetical protein [Candidatus Pacearchaeota archaeon]
MKIAFTNVDFKSFTGPNQFSFKLATQFEAMGHDISNGLTDEDTDINLVIIESFNFPENVPTVLRLDGIWFKPDDFMTKNAGIFATYNEADGIIFQSEFDKKMIEKHFGARDDIPTCVIRNGTFVKKFDTENIDLEWLNNIRNDFNKIFVASSQWTNRSHKRLHEAIRFVDEYTKWDGYERCCLITMGESDKFEALTETKYSDKFTQIHLGNIPPAQTYVPYCYADWFIHLAYLDHCPNVAVDAIACQVPVICSSEGGTRELLFNSDKRKLGLIINEEPFDFELTDYTNPPKMTFTEEHFSIVRNGYDLQKDWVKHVHVKNVAKKYIDFFNEVKIAYKYRQ